VTAGKLKKDGARPVTDIPVDENGMVSPGTGGMSVNELPTGMPTFRSPRPSVEVLKIPTCTVLNLVIWGLICSIALSQDRKAMVLWNLLG
jgi:hypothetical protein